MDIFNSMIKKTLLLTLLLSFQVSAEQIRAFKSDGCSHFPDGTVKQRDLWCECCITHDIAYWQGGSKLQKKTADKVLRDCVLNKTGNRLLADAMYYGVTVGGSPVYPIGYRWGFGWSYGRGFKTLSDQEKHQVESKLIAYKKLEIGQRCDFEYPLLNRVKQRVGTLFNK